MNGETTQPSAEVPGLETMPAALDRAIEALLLASEAALSVDQLQHLLAADDPRIERAEVRAALVTLADRLNAGASEIVEVAGGWRLQVRAEFNAVVAQLWREKPPRLSRALLETLALIVYRQPITRGEIEEVRGVSVSTNIVRTLLEREWIRELGHKEVPGRPALYGTTARLLDDLGIKSLDQLPDLPAIQDPEQLEAALRKLGVEPDAIVEAPEAAIPDDESGDGETRLAAEQPVAGSEPAAGGETSVLGAAQP